MGDLVDSLETVISCDALRLLTLTLLASPVPNWQLKSAQSIIYCVLPKYIFIECCVVCVVVHSNVCDVYYILRAQHIIK